MATIAELIAAEQARLAEQQALERRRAALAAAETARLYEAARQEAFMAASRVSAPSMAEVQAAPNPYTPSIPEATTPAAPRYIVPDYEPTYLSSLPGSGAGWRPTAPRMTGVTTDTREANRSTPGSANWAWQPYTSTLVTQATRDAMAQRASERMSAAGFRESAPPFEPPEGYEWAPSEMTWQDGGITHYQWSLVPKTQAQAAVRAASTGTNTGGSSGGGGTYYGGGGSTTTTTADVDPLGELSWWPTGDSIQPLLRNWAAWMHELVEANRLANPVPNPFVYDAEAEKAYASLDEEKGPVAPGFRSSKDVLSRLQSLLGVGFAAEDTKTQQWQKVIDAIPNAGLEAQQLLTSLRFDADSGRWYSTDTPQLANPKYI